MRNNCISKKFFTFSLGLFFLINICISQGNDLDSNSTLSISNSSLINDYKFDSPTLAHRILTELDSFNRLPPYIETTIRNKRNVLYLDIDDAYCDKHRKYFVEHSDAILHSPNIFNSLGIDYLISLKVIKKIAKQLHPEELRRKLRGYQPITLPDEIQVFYASQLLHRSYYIGKQFACNTQAYSHIPGSNSMNRKSNMSLNYQDYFNAYADSNRPQCIDNFIPESYMLMEHNQCKKFFEYINSEKYEQEKLDKGIVFFRKIGHSAHRGEGVFIFDEEDEKNLRNRLRNGQACPLADPDIQMQKYIENPLLLYGHKFDFRVYMLIASTNPIIGYYHDGFLKLSVHLHDQQSRNKAVHLSNTELSKEIFEKANKEKWLGMNAEELKAFQTWTYPRLQNYLLETGKINDTNWLENYMIPRMKTIMAHTIRFGQHQILKRSQLFEIYGCDFMLDENLNLWLIEINTSPMMEGTSLDRETLLVNMMKDHFNVIFSYLRSRIKRIITYVKGIIAENKIPVDYIFYATTKLPCYEMLKEDYDEINKNYLEKEFMIDERNGFKKIIDENLEGVDRYCGFIKEDCLENSYMGSKQPSQVLIQ